MKLKTVLGLIITIIFTSSIISSSDSTNSVIDSTEFDLKSQLTEDVDNFDAKYYYSIEDKQNKWWDSQILPTLLGSFLAAIIAVLSIIFTHKKYRNTEKEKQDNKFKSLLLAIKDEVINNVSITKVIKEEIDVYLHTIKVTNKAIGTEAFSIVKIDFIKQCRLNIIDNDNTNSDIVNLISRYIDKGLAINTSLKSSNFIAVVNFLPKGASLYKHLKVYFDAVLDLISDLEGGSDFFKQALSEMIKEIKLESQNSADDI